MVETTATYWPAGLHQPSELLRWGADLRLDDRWAVGRLDLSDAAADLLEVASTIYATDRLVPRGPWRRSGYGSDWRRAMRVRIPVRDISAWHGVRRHLAAMLSWLTDDDWTLEFAAGQGPLTKLQQPLLPVPLSDVDVLLFSGGLDSTAGLARDLSGAVRDVVAVSVYTNSRMQVLQREIVGVLNRTAHRRALPVQYQVQLGLDDRENTQRSRGFLFLAAGVASAWALGRDRLRVHENGIGAINLPYLRSQVGSQATRAVHPRTVTMMEQLARQLSGHPFTIETPHLEMTKAELVRACSPVADGALSRSLSCDYGFATRIPGTRPCGACTSCLLRRQALHAAGRSDLDRDVNYRTNDLVGPNRDGLSAMLWQLGRLRRCLSQPDVWGRLVAEFPQVVCVPPRLGPESLTRLYGAYVDEWEDLPPLFGTTQSAYVPPPRQEGEGS